MKILVISDSHGRDDRLGRVMDMHKNADALIFLGDGINDLVRADAELYGFTVYAVSGNCDGLFSFLGSKYPTELTLNLGGVRILAMHGHTRSVKSGIDGAMLAAEQKEADILLFGHTHSPINKYFPEGREYEYGKLSKPLYVFNPGSLQRSEDGRAHFGLIQIKDGNVLISSGTLD